MVAVTRQFSNTQMLADLASSRAGNCNVTLVTSRKLYNDPLARLSRFDECLRVEILRLGVCQAISDGTIEAVDVRGHQPMTDYIDLC
jgi:hypothetical protein